MNKSKIVIIAILGLLAVVVIYLCYEAFNKDEKKEEVTLSADVPKEFSHEEMLKAKEGANYQGSNPSITEDAATSVDNNYQSKDEAEIRQLQQQIVLNNNRASQESQEDVSHDYTEEYVPAKKKKTKARKEQVEQIESEIGVGDIPKEEKKEVKQQEAAKPSRFFNGTRGQKNVSNSIRAVVHGDQVVGDGATLKMRLIQDAFSENQEVIPKNTFIFGTVTISEERIKVKITSVRVKNNILKLEKQVYDRDAIEGIYAPGSVKSEIRNETTNDAISSINPTSTEGLIEAGANTLLQAGKRVVSRSTRKIRILIKTNYEIYLK